MLAASGGCRILAYGMFADAIVGLKDPLDGGTAAAELALAEKGAYEGGFWEDEGKGMEKVPW